MKKAVLFAASIAIAAAAHAAPIEKQCAALAKVAGVVVLLKEKGVTEGEVKAELKGDERVANAITSIYAGGTADQVKADCLAAKPTIPARIGRTPTDANGAQTISDVLITN